MEKYIDARMQAPFTMGIFGSREVGKSFFTKQLILNQEQLIYPIFERVVWIHKHYQKNIFDDLQEKLGNKLVLLNEFPNFKSISKQENTVFIFDDFISETVDSKDVQQLYISGRHLNISVISLSQNMFMKGKFSTTMNRNTDYLVLFENIRDKTIIRTLSYQMYPGNTRFLIDAFNDATKKKFGHLFLDCKPNSDELLRVRGNIFDFSDKFTIYLPKEYKTEHNMF